MANNTVDFFLNFKQKGSKILKENVESLKKMANAAKLSGKATEEMGDDLNKAENDVTKLDKSIKSLNGRMEGVGKSVKTLVGAVGIGLALNQIKEYTKEVFNSTNELANFSKRAGVAMGDFQAFADVGERFGVSVQTIGDKLHDLNERVQELAAYGTGEAKDPFLQLGLSAEKLKKLSPEKQFEAIVDAMKDLDTLAQKQVLDQMNIDDLEPLVKNLGEVKKRRDDLLKNGLLLNSSAEFDALNKDILTFKQNLEAFTATILKDIIPGLQEMYEGPGGESIFNADNAKTIANNLLTIVKIFDLMFNSINTIITAIKELTNLSTTFIKKVQIIYGTDGKIKDVRSKEIKELNSSGTNSVAISPRVNAVVDSAQQELSTINYLLKGAAGAFNAISPVKINDNITKSLDYANKAVDETQTRIQKTNEISSKAEDEVIALKKKREEDLAKNEKQSIDTSKRNQESFNKNFAALEKSVSNFGEKPIDVSKMLKLEQKTVDNLLGDAFESAGKDSGKRFITALTNEIIANKNNIAKAEIQFGLSDISKEKAISNITEYYDAIITKQKSIDEANNKKSGKSSDEQSIELLNIRLEKQTKLESIKNTVNKSDKETELLLAAQLSLLQATGKTEESNAMLRAKAIDDVKKSISDLDKQSKTIDLVNKLFDTDALKNKVSEVEKQLSFIDVKLEIDPTFTKDMAVTQITQYYDQIIKLSTELNDQDAIYSAQLNKKKAIYDVTNKETKLESEKKKTLQLQMQLYSAQGNQLKANQIERQNTIDEINKTITDAGEKATQIDLANKIFDIQDYKSNLELVEKDLDTLNSKLLNTSITNKNEILSLETAIADKTKERTDLQSKLGVEQDKTNQNYIFTVGKINKLNEDLKTSFLDIFSDFASGTKSATTAFNDFATFFLKKISEMILEQLYLNAVSALSGKSTGSSGQTAGLGSLVLGAFSGFSMPSYHTGGDVGGNRMLQIPGITKSDETIAKLRKGERVVTKNQQYNDQLRTATFENNNTSNINIDDDSLTSAIGSNKNFEKYVLKVVKQNPAIIRTLSTR